MNFFIQIIYDHFSPNKKDKKESGQQKLGK